MKTSQNQRLNGGFFCTQAPNGDIGQSTCGDGELSYADLKKEVDDFRLHYHIKFRENFQAIGDLTMKLEVKSDLPTFDLERDDNQDDYKVISDSSSKVCEVGVGNASSGSVDGAFVKGINFMESVVAPPSKDDLCEPQGGQLVEEVPAGATDVVNESKADPSTK
ncbi:hypothetical protein HAX54_021322 [Datura stramonium]|uniref:Uncharacterized protein n=1 Tax=Datura stramonium TaxID=4076 RepID=A0ABS8USQ7_DATST|nr:hypothetical protein [Datura stramonium]